MPMNAEALAALLALVGVVILVAALMSGWLERANLPQVAVFLLLGAVIGPLGLGLMKVELDTPILRIVSTLALALVLFTDAVTISLREVRQHLRLASLILGPGTLIAVALIACGGVMLLGLNWIESIVLASALASTDPVMLRGLLHSKDLPSNARIALRLESGLNDVILLPLLIIAMSFLDGSSETRTDVGRMLVNLFLLGPIAGVLVGFVAITALRWAREKIGVRRDYESIYSLGVCFAAFAAAESVHGSGFLACFAAGIVISAMDPELCDCFVEYGETTAEMLLLFTFVLLGGSLIWSGFSILSVGLVVFAVLALLARPLGLLVSLAGEKMDRASRLLVAWFGPRGLSSLLLILLPVFAGVNGSHRLFEICSFVVVLSVLVHGSSIFALNRKKPSSFDSQLRQTSAKSNDVSLSVDLLKEKLAQNEPLYLLDVRSHRSFDESDEVLAEASRIDPDKAVREMSAMQIPKDAWAALFCT